MKTLTPEQDRYRLTIHEIAHHLIASHYQLGSAPVVFSPTQLRPTQADGATLGGLTRFAGTGTKFQMATIGWAGTIGELLAGASNFDICFPLEKATAKCWFNITIASLMELSESDRAMIVGYSKSYWLSFKRAFDILSKNKRVLLRLAKAPKPAPKVVAPPPAPEPAPPLPTALLPETFPANKEDFIRLIIVPPGKAAETLNGFAAAQLPRLGSVSVLMTWLERSLQDRPGWEALARDYFRWAQSA